MKTLTIFKLEPTTPNTSHNSRFFFPIRKARSAVTEILTCVGNVRRENVFQFSVSLQISSPFLHSLQTFRSNTARVALVRKVLLIMPNRPVRVQWEYPRKMERHFPTKNTPFRPKHAFKEFEMTRNKHQEDSTNEKIERLNKQ